ncbi:MAG: hypothetical protein HKN15_07855 [Xanthomonadales bacterium]|nr:hypothetical protein [Xanthomonadales bacterium]
MMTRFLTRFALVALLSTQAMAATIEIQNGDDPGEGFNDPNPPTNANQRGNNPATTLGQMRLNVFEAAADVWGDILQSNQTITVNAKFDELTCGENSGTLGSAGATSSATSFTGGENGVSYVVALAESLGNANFNGSSAEINATFNSLVDSDANCLGGGGFYYGLDGNPPAGTSNLFTTVLHELGHGLGFNSLTDVAPDGSGGFLGAGGFPDTFSRNLLDLDSGKTWDQMNNAERKASALNEPSLVWNGANATADRANHLGGSPELVINAPGSIAGTFEAVLGDEPTIILTTGGVTADVVDGNNFGDGCSQINEGSFTGRIILFDATESCTAVFPAFFSEFATGAVGVLIADTTGSGLPDVSGQVSNQEITIPYIGITKAVADSIRANIGSANVTIRRSTTVLNGENQGKVKMHAPAEFSEGASVSHWSKSASPDLLMEPSLGALDHEDVDLTAAAFADIGWFLTNQPQGFTINAGLNDAWVSSTAPLQGFFFTVYPDLGFFFMSLFTFDSQIFGGGNTATFAASDQRWVTGGAFYNGDSVTIPVELTTGGIFNGSNPTAGQTPNYGTITITFINCNQATLTYNFPGQNLSGQLTLTRVVTDNVALCQSMQQEDPTSVNTATLLAESNHAELELAQSIPDYVDPPLAPYSPNANMAVNINAGMNDAWVSALAPLQGLFFTVYPDLGLLFLSWFTFDSVLSGGNTATFGASDQRWVTGAGFYSGNSVTVPVELTSGGIFLGSNPTASQQANYGTITITFNSCNEAILTYDFPSVGLSGMMTLTRVVEDNISLCEMLASG